MNEVTEEKEVVTEVQPEQVTEANKEVVEKEEEPLKNDGLKFVGILFVILLVVILLLPYLSKIL